MTTAGQLDGVFLVMAKIPQKLHAWQLKHLVGCILLLFAHHVIQ